MIVKAKVFYFSRRDGDGLMKVEGIGTRRCNAAGIPGKKTLSNHTACVYYDEGQEIEVEVDEEGCVTKLLTPGKFDEFKWNGLNHDRA